MKVPRIEVAPVLQHPQVPWPQGGKDSGACVVARQRFDLSAVTRYAFSGVELPAKVP